MVEKLGKPAYSSKERKEKINQRKDVVFEGKLKEANLNVHEERSKDNAR